MSIGCVRSAGHSERFVAAARQVQRGGPLAAVCGARTRTGAACAQEPLAGGVRCLRHAGPRAAAAHRDSQLAGLRTGRVTPEVFARAEARRARNRLVDAWKRNPSVPGSTIDLGPDEGAFSPRWRRMASSPARTCPPSRTGCAGAIVVA